MEKTKYSPMVTWLIVGILIGIGFAVAIVAAAIFF